MYGSHDMRHTDFPQVDGGKRDPREMGRPTKCWVWGREARVLNHIEN